MRGGAIVKRTPTIGEAGRWWWWWRVHLIGSPKTRTAAQADGEEGLTRLASSSGKRAKEECGAAEIAIRPARDEKRSRGAVLYATSRPLLRFGRALLYGRWLCLSRIGQVPELVKRGEAKAGAEFEGALGAKAGDRRVSGYGGGRDAAVSR